MDAFRVNVSISTVYPHSSTSEVLLFGNINEDPSQIFKNLQGGFQKIMRSKSLIQICKELRLPVECATQTSHIKSARELKRLQDLSKEIALPVEAILNERLDEYALELERRKALLDKWYVPNVWTCMATGCMFFWTTTMFDPISGGIVGVISYTGCLGIQRDSRNISAEVDFKQYAIYALLEKKLNEKE